MIIGITPGLHQMFLSCQEAQRALAVVGDEVLRRAAAVGGFAGPMRSNLTAMLDGICLASTIQVGEPELDAPAPDHTHLLVEALASIYGQPGAGQLEEVPGPAASIKLRRFSGSVHGRPPSLWCPGDRSAPGA